MSSKCGISRTVDPDEPRGSESALFKSVVEGDIAAVSSVERPLMPSFSGHDTGRDSMLNVTPDSLSPPASKRLSHLSADILGAGLLPMKSTGNLSTATCEGSDPGSPPLPRAPAHLLVSAAVYSPVCGDYKKRNPPVDDRAEWCYRHTFHSISARPTLIQEHMLPCTEFHVTKPVNASSSATNERFCPRCGFPPDKCSSPRPSPRDDHSLKPQKFWENEISNVNTIMRSAQGRDYLSGRTPDMEANWLSIEERPLNDGQQLTECQTDLSLSPARSTRSSGSMSSFVESKKLFVCSEAFGAPKPAYKNGGSHKRVPSQQRALGTRYDSPRSGASQSHRESGRSKSGSECEDCIRRSAGKNSMSRTALFAVEGVHASKLVHLRRLRNGHYRRVSKPRYRRGDDGLFEDPLSQSFHRLKNCSCCAVEDASHVLISPNASISRRTGRDQGENNCRNYHEFEENLKGSPAKERDLPRRRSEQETESVSRLKAKIEELKDALRVADQRIATQQQDERAYIENVKALRQKLHRLEEKQTSGGSLNSETKLVQSQLNEQEVPLREAYIPKVATEDIGVQTRNVGVILLREPRLKSGIYADILLGSERRMMALRVDYALRLIVLTHQDTIKLIPVLDVLRMLTKYEELRRLLEKQGVRREEVPDEEIDHIVALFLSAGNPLSPLVIVFRSEHLRNVFVAHVTQLRFSAEVEGGHLFDKGFHGEQFKDDWLSATGGKKY
ncbi:hypothetical protein TGMAS_266080 [Toxoplasma gondii MAS]|uniref:Uncharacterized protein n=2 Tax=Toxoplasma gondii TaxID=5811 RepID=A0A086Q844_TOXGO|nr:hypothetical protein TGMAS_266080 [Toxoplasma gondii MAS]PUA85242.1 hypothetical protein TGBR9_266080 [Toxoplasma gondii TgCATBr9]